MKETIQPTMSSLILDNNPKFYIRNIDAYSLVQRLFAGEYVALEQPPPTKISSSLVSHTTITEESKGEESERYNLKNGSYTTNIVTVHQDTFQRTSKQVRCQWCKSVMLIDNAIGIPVKHNKNIFYTLGHHCCFGCAYARLRCILQQYRATAQGAKYLYSEQLIKYLHELMHPDKKLQPCPDWELLDDNGGPLTKDEFFSRSADSFVPLTSITIVPEKTAYWMRR